MARYEEPDSICIPPILKMVIEGHSDEKIKLLFPKLWDCDLSLIRTAKEIHSGVYEIQGKLGSMTFDMNAVLDKSGGKLKGVTEIL